jgi:FG-GAP repeat
MRRKSPFRCRSQAAFFQKACATQSVPGRFTCRPDIPITPEASMTRIKIDDLPLNEELEHAQSKAICGGWAPFAGFVGGVRVASGDVNGDGTADLITAAGVGGGPHVKVFSAQTL